MRKYKKEHIMIDKHLYGELILYIQESENKFEKIETGQKKKPLTKMPELYKKLLKEGQNPDNHITFGWSTD